MHMQRLLFFKNSPLRSRPYQARSWICRSSAHMYKHTHAGVCAGFSAAVDTGERRGSAGGKRKEVEGGGREKDRQSEGNGEGVRLWE